MYGALEKLDDNMDTKKASENTREHIKISGKWSVRST
jgi:hypothetical protein